ncbi:Dual-specificity_protein phosphatase [Hexamita inflata]|uniref:Dual-specificity protein phosphatase n=1 Tax=Hexamita inflata TaxID=28002 RepID=A0AA86NNH3_9EUKA|nr:Dual-specificity protein phosphatase [Hexamita inflata]
MKRPHQTQIKRENYSQIMDNLYLGGIRCKKILIENCHSAIAITDYDMGKPEWADNYVHYELCDTSTESVELVVNAIFGGIKFIEDNIQNGVLVYCGLGVSRSSTVVIAYIMKALKLSYEDAFKYVQQKRTCVRPNALFQKVLQNFRFDN